MKRTWKRSRDNVETAMDRLEQMRLSLQQDMGPAEMIKHLQELGLIDKSDTGDDDASLFEVNASALMQMKPNVTPTMQHDPWWYEDLDAEYDDDDNWTGELAEHVSRHTLNLTGQGEQQSVHVNNNSRMYADPDQLFSMQNPFRRLSNKLSVSSWSVKHRLHVIYVFLGTCLILASVGMMHAGGITDNNRDIMVHAWDRTILLRWVPQL